MKKESTWNPTTLAAQLEKFADHGWLNFVAGAAERRKTHSRDCANGGGQEAAYTSGGIAPAVYSGIEAMRRRTARGRCWSASAPT